MKKKLVNRLVVGMLGVVLIGCGNTATETTSENAVEQTVEENAVEEVVETEVEETTESTEEPEVEEEPEEVIPKTYAEENGLEFYEGSAFTTQGVAYNPDDISEYIAMDVPVEFTSIGIEDDEEDGYRKVIIEAVKEVKCPSKYYIWVPSTEVWDIYTGRVVPSADTWNDMTVEYDTELEWNENTYSIGYTYTTEWDMPVIDGYYDGACTSTIVIKIPEDYDGLALYVAPSTEPPEEDKEYGVVDDSEEEYLLDDWKDGTYLLRVSDLYRLLNGQEMP